MGDFFNQLRTQLNLFFSNLTLKQKMMVFAGAAVALAIILVMLVWTSRPTYTVLFSNLSQKDAGVIVEALRERKIDYKIENGGTTILVPANKVYELRLDLARQGLPQTSSVGYEIFDKTNLGMTDFLQKLNYRRALEGELTRTIEQIESVEKARVHIVIPEETLFKEDQKQPSASVVLKLRRRGSISPEQVQGIIHLIASSVEGLEPENVTIVDTRGRILSNNTNPNNLLTMTASQLEFTHKVESYLASKAQSMLDQVLGPGNAVVRVSAELDFTRVEKTIEEYDPDNTAIRSEEIEEQITPVAENNASGTTSTSSGNGRVSSTITNYEINKTVQHIIDDVGNIKRLSVAVLINNKMEKAKGEDGKETIRYVPRSPEEMNTLAELVKRSVGYDATRQDEFSINNINFSLPAQELNGMFPEEESPWSNYYEIIEKVLLILAILGAMLIMRSLFGQVKKRNEELQSQLLQIEQTLNLPQLPGGTLPGSDDEFIPRELTAPEKEEEIIHAQDFFKSLSKPNALNAKIRSYIQQNPDEATRLLKVWLLEEEQQNAA